MQWETKPLLEKTFAQLVAVALIIRKECHYVLNCVFAKTYEASSIQSSFSRMASM